MASPCPIAVRLVGGAHRAAITGYDQANVYSFGMANIFTLLQTMPGTGIIHLSQQRNSKKPTSVRKALMHSATTLCQPARQRHVQSYIADRFITGYEPRCVVVQRVFSNCFS